jgi:hypothetical protein
VLILARDSFGRLLRAYLPLLLCAALGAAPHAAAAQSATKQIVGTYRLAMYSQHGDEPTGRISYDAAGRMWAMIFPPGREPVTQQSTAEEVRTTMRGVIAYYGTYTVDEATGRVIHHVEAASNPAWIGEDFIRWYRFQDGDLWISLNEKFDNPLFWERLPEAASNDRSTAAGAE